MIKTTRLKTSQAPMMKTYDLSDQMDGQRQTFTLPILVTNQQSHYLIFNSTVYRNTSSHTYYTIAGGGALTTYFDEAPTPGADHNLQFVVSDVAEGATDFISQAELLEATTYIKNYSDDKDRVLQNQIDTIKAASDVVDVVPTYDDLMLYDTSKITMDDIIKVLVDRTHGNGQSYYRWNVTWHYMATLAPYYTKAEIDDLLDDKADAQDLTDAVNRIDGDLAAKADTTYVDGKIEEVETMIGDIEAALVVINDGEPEEEPEEEPEV